MEEPRIRILLVDDHDVVRGILRRLLQSQPDLFVVGEAANGADGLTRAKELQPDVILVDINLPDTNGLSLAERVKMVVPAAEIVIVSDYTEGEIEKAFRGSVRGYLLKSDAATELVTAVRTVFKKQQYLSKKLR